MTLPDAKVMEQSLENLMVQLAGAIHCELPEQVSDNAEIDINIGGRSFDVRIKDGPATIEKTFFGSKIWRKLEQKAEKEVPDKTVPEAVEQDLNPVSQYEPEKSGVDDEVKDTILNG